MERKILSQNQTERAFEHRRDGFISALAFGGFLVIVGVVLVLNHNLWQQITAFFNNLTTKTVPFPSNSTSNLALPAPADPASHSALYKSVMQFDVGMGILQILILVFRLQTHSMIGRVAGTMGNLVFWIGAALLVNKFLLAGTLSSWFEYWAAIIVLIGASIIARALVYIAKK
jgi:hypothetical protein